MSKNIFVLDHYYAINHKKFCIVIESENTPDEMVKICSSIAFLLEDVTEPSAALDMNCLLKVLETYYGAKDKKKEAKESLKYLNLPIDGIYMCIPYEYFRNAAYIIDLYEARESCCGEKYKMIMEEWLPKGEDLERLKKLLQECGEEK